MRFPRPRFKARGLRGLLTALALSTLALPMALGLLARTLVSGGATDEVVFRLSVVSQEIRKALVATSPEGPSVRSDYRPPGWLTLIVVDRDSKVRYSSSDQVRPGEGFDDLAAARLSRSLGSDPQPGTVAFSIFSDIIPSPGAASRGRFFALVSASDATVLENHGQPWIILIGLSCLALFAVIASALVSTTIASTVLRLEKAARRIATGDLEGPVGERGVKEIVSLAAAMDEMRLALKENKDRRNRFLASISHDLRTPLTSISGYLEAIEDGLAAEPETLSRYVSIMEAKTSLLEERISALLDFARMETDEWRIGFVDLELGAFLDSLGREFAEDARLEGRSFSWEVSGALGTKVPADPALLRRALENLLFNALRYAPPGGRLFLGCQTVPGGLLVHVDDEGPGIARDEEDRIFEPFYRGRAAREGEGRGLGLYIARSVILGHGWGLEAGTSPLGGARFTVRVPL